MKKKLVAALASVSLVATLGVGATLAYYTSVSEERVNTFTIGNVNIELTEPEWDNGGKEDAKGLVPGAEAAKNPMITNTGSSNGYMMMAVDGMEEMESMGFVAMNNGVAGYNITDWVLVDENGVIRTDNPENKLVDGYYVYIGTANSETAEPVGSVAAGESTAALFTSVKLSEDAPEIAATSYQIVSNFVDADGRLFTYKDVNGNTIEANKDKVPTVDDAGALVVKYTINGVANMTFDSHAKAEAYVLENYSADASFVFDLTVQAYSIQAKEVAYTTERGAYAWVEQFNTDAN